MTGREIIKHIDDGAVFYLDFFGNAEHMESTDNGFYRVIRSKENEQGLSFVYDIRLEDLSEKDATEKIAEIKALKLPTWWPLCLSDGLYRSIHQKEKEKAPLVLPDGEELYMAITSAEQMSVVRQPNGTVIKRVQDAESFALWAQSVEAFFNDDYQYIHPRYYYPACESGKIRCYICYREDCPAAVCAILNNGGICSLEFVATHSGYRRQGFAKYICAFAMEEAFAGGARLITLRASNPGTRELYTSLGFQIYNYAI